MKRHIEIHMRKILLAMLFLAVISASCDKGGESPEPSPPTEDMTEVIVFTTTAVTNLGGEEVTYRKICAMTPDGTRKVVLHDGAAFDMKYAEANRGALDPTGTKLVLQGGDYYIWEYDLSTKRHVTVIDKTPGINVDDPLYSPDGGKILYANWASGDILETVMRNGTNRTTLTNGDYALGRQNYIPDGTKIVASNWMPWTYICTFNANGTGGKKILTAAAEESFDCPWPLSNTRIIYVHYEGAEKVGLCTIRACNIDGSNSVKIGTPGAGDCTLDYLTCNAGGTLIGYYESSAFESKYIVRQLGATSLGTIVSTTTEGTRFRFGHIKKAVFDAAPNM